MLYVSRSKKEDKPHRGAGALFASSVIAAGVNTAAVESTGNTTMDTIRYGASALLLGGMAVVSFFKFGRNFEATMPPCKELPATQEPKAPNPSRGAGPLFVASAITATANLGAAVETLNSVGVDTIRNGATALLLGGMAVTSLVNRLRGVEAPAPQLSPESFNAGQPSTVKQQEEPAYQFAEIGAPVAEFPRLAAERAIPGRLSPAIVVLAPNVSR